MKKIGIVIQSKKQEVKLFLDNLKSILQDAAFDADVDLQLIRSKKDPVEFSTPHTLRDLDYDASDVVARLQELTIAEYSETKLDRDDLNPPFLFVFGKDINNKQVYIKLKLKEKPTRRIVCVSFHYAQERMIFPYA